MQHTTVDVLYNGATHKVRTFKYPGGNYQWYVVIDVCNALGKYTNGSYMWARSTSGVSDPTYVRHQKFANDALPHVEYVVVHDHGLKERLMRCKARDLPFYAALKKAETRAPASALPTTFIFDGKTLRVVTDQDQNPWFVGAEVASILKYARPRDAVRKFCKHAKTLKGVESTLLTSSPYGIKIIPESDLYRLIIKSRLPAAEKFETWVMETVLPTIRRTGSYATQTNLRNESPQELAIRAIKALQCEIEVLTPKAKAYDALVASKPKYAQLALPVV